MARYRIRAQTHHDGLWGDILCDVDTLEELPVAVQGKVAMLDAIDPIGNERELPGVGICRTGAHGDRIYYLDMFKYKEKDHG